MISTVGREAATQLLGQWNITALLYIQLSQMISRNAKKKSGWIPFFPIVFSSVSNQGQECFLNYVRSRLWVATHMHGIPVQAALMAPVEL
jgi:hypothetical protein